jgi:hypothetical protein
MAEQFQGHRRRKGGLPVNHHNVVADLHHLSIRYADRETDGDFEADKAHVAAIIRSSAICRRSAYLESVAVSMERLDRMSGYQELNRLIHLATAYL